MTRITVKAMKRALKKAGLKTTGKKAALTRRAKKAHLKMRGGEGEPPAKRARVGPGPEEAAAAPVNNPPDVAVPAGDAVPAAVPGENPDDAAPVVPMDDDVEMDGARRSRRSRRRRGRKSRGSRRR
jgi:hypothetical protein